MVEYRIHIRTHRVNIVLIIEHICTTSTSNKYSVELEDIYIVPSTKICSSFIGRRFAIRACAMDTDLTVYFSFNIR